MHVKECRIGFNAAGVPLSPMSDCRSKGLHYTVKHIRESRTAGVECLICGLCGDLDKLKRLPCLAEPADEEPEPAVLTHAEQAAQDAAAVASAESELRRLQEVEDRKAALDLMELQKQEAELEQMVLLHQLETEEIVLQGLLNEQKALALAEAAVAKKLEFSSGSSPEPTPTEPKHPRRTQAHSKLEPETVSVGKMPEPLVSIVPSLDLPYGAQMESIIILRCCCSNIAVIISCTYTVAYFVFPDGR